MEKVVPFSARAAKASADDLFWDSGFRFGVQDLRLGFRIYLQG